MTPLTVTSVGCLRRAGDEAHIQQTGKGPLWVSLLSPPQLALPVPTRAMPPAQCPEAACPTSVPLRDLPLVLDLRQCCPAAPSAGVKVFSICISQ